MNTMHKFFKLGLIILLSINYMQTKAQKKIDNKKLDALINLSKFVDWHPTIHNNKTNNVIIIYTNNNSSINYELNSVNKFKYKSWQIICCKNKKDIINHAIVLLTQEKEEEKKMLIHLSKEKDILLVGDNISNFCEEGGMINMINIDGETRFEINYKEIQNSSIEINSKLLTLSKIL